MSRCSRFAWTGPLRHAIDPRFDTDALENVRKRVDGPDLKHAVETMLRRGYDAQGITQTADEVGCDLIVMGTHGRTGLSRLMMGSVAENVLPKANCPVLVVKSVQQRLGTDLGSTGGRSDDRLLKNGWNPDGKPVKAL